MLDNDIYHAHLVVEKDGKRSLHPAGRLLVHDGHVLHLEDNHDMLGHIPEGLITPHTMSQIAAPPPNLLIGARSHVRAGHRLDMIPEAELEPMPAPPTETEQKAAITARPPSVWHYTRVGHDKPHVIEAANGAFTLDGNPLAHDELATILHNVKSKTARLRYPRPSLQDAVAKREATFDRLLKADHMNPQDALKHVESLGGDEQTKAAVAALRYHLFTDPMTGLGNKLAYSHFMSEPRGGVHLGIELNHFKSINDTYGHHHGDEAIKAFGGAVRDTLNEVAPPGENGGSGHRVGGDEFHVHLPSHEHAAHFARALRSRLEQLPLVGGTHRLSASIGAGADPHMADAAVYEAKRQKMTPAGPHAPHTIPHVLYHSLVPGHEGPMQHELPAPPKLPEAPKPPEVTPAAKVA